MGAGRQIKGDSGFNRVRLAWWDGKASEESVLPLTEKVKIDTAGGNGEGLLFFGVFLHNILVELAQDLHGVQKTG